MLLDISSIILDRLIEILLGLIVLFNITAFSVIWQRLHENEEATEKNSETLNMIINRIFGLDRDPTDKGYIMESERRFDSLTDQLDDIEEKQDQMRKEQREEYVLMDDKISKIIDVLVEEEKVEADEEDFDIRRKTFRNVELSNE